LKEEEQQWPEVQEEMNRSLASMRVDYGMHIKALDNSNNALLNKRKKAKGTEGGSGDQSTKF